MSDTGVKLDVPEFHPPVGVWSLMANNKSRVPIQPWRIVYFRRHKQDDPMEQTPARTFRDACPERVRAEIDATLAAVAWGPPPMFSGGLRWKAMHQDMAGYFEVRVKGPRHQLYRVFCLLERQGEGLPGPAIILIEGLVKANETAFTASDYAKVR